MRRLLDKFGLFYLTVTLCLNHDLRNLCSLIEERLSLTFRFEDVRLLTIALDVELSDYLLQHELIQQRLDQECVHLRFRL